MIEWFLAQSEEIQFAYGIGFINIMLFVLIFIKDSQLIRKGKYEKEFAELERTCGKMS